MHIGDLCTGVSGGDDFSGLADFPSSSIPITINDKSFRNGISMRNWRFPESWITLYQTKRVGLWWSRKKNHNTAMEQKLTKCLSKDAQTLLFVFFEHVAMCVVDENLLQKLHHISSLTWLINSLPLFYLLIINCYFCSEYNKTRQNAWVVCEAHHNTPWRLVCDCDIPPSLA